MSLEKVRSHCVVRTPLGRPDQGVRTTVWPSETWLRCLTARQDLFAADQVAYFGWHSVQDLPILLMASVNFGKL